MNIEDFFVPRCPLRDATCDFCGKFLPELVGSSDSSLVCHCPPRYGMATDNPDLEGR